MVFFSSSSSGIPNQKHNSNDVFIKNRQNLMCRSFLDVGGLLMIIILMVFECERPIKRLQNHIITFPICFGHDTSVNVNSVVYITAGLR